MILKNNKNNLLNQKVFIKRYSLKSKKQILMYIINNMQKYFLVIFLSLYQNNLIVHKNYLINSKQFKHLNSVKINKMIQIIIEDQLLKHFLNYQNPKNVFVITVMVSLFLLHLHTFLMCLYLKINRYVIQLLSILLIISNLKSMLLQ